MQKKSQETYFPKVDRLLRPPHRVNGWLCDEIHAPYFNQWIVLDNRYRLGICDLCGLKVRAIDEVD
jgi:hypothetical protein